MTKRSSKYLLTGSIIAAIIILSPYFLYIYKSFPNEPIWKTFFGTYTNQYYSSMQSLAWLFFGKFVPLTLLIIWFFTCKHWWYHALIVPITIYAFQLISVLNDDIQFVDEFEIWWALPVMFIIAPFVYLTRAKLFNRMRGADLAQFEEELLQRKTIWQQFKELFR